MFGPNFDEYWDDEDVVCSGTCGSCEQRKLVVWCEDPYVQEIYNREELGWWCPECHYQACQDV